MVTFGVLVVKAKQNSNYLVNLLEIAFLSGNYLVVVAELVNSTLFSYWENLLKSDRLVVYFPFTINMHALLGLTVEVYRVCFVVIDGLHRL